MQPFKPTWDVEVTLGGHARSPILQRILMVVEKQAAVGWRVRVFWEADDEWFEGVVAKYSPQSGYFVHYDDGEKQWEVEDPDIFEFLSKPKTSSSLEDAQLILASEEEGELNEDVGEGAHKRPDKWSAQPPPSTNGDAEDEYGDDYEDDHEHDDDAEDHQKQVRESANSPTPEKASPVKQPASKQTGSLSRQPRDPTKYVKSGVFFRDEETLRDTKAALQKEKQEVKTQYEALAMQLQHKELASASLKRELQGLKAQVSLSSLTENNSNSSRGNRKTATDWAKLVLEQKTANRSTRQELSASQTQITQKKTAVQQMGKQKELLQTRLDRVPRKDLCSLVDVEMEIAQLMNDKRSLETQLAKAVNANQTVTTKTRDAARVTTISAQADAKTELEHELRKVEHVLSRVSDEVDQWRLSYEKENARIQPLKSRLDSLQQELNRYESSQVLLRSVFLRLDRDGSGKIAKDRVVDALALLTPQTDTKTRDEIENAVQMLLKANESTTEVGLDLKAFTQCFHAVFSKSSN